MAEVGDPGDHRLAMEPTEPPGRLGSRFPAVLARANAGDASAFGELWRSAHPGVLRYLFVFCSGQDAEDVASETWLKVIRSLHTFSGDEQDFRAWLTTVARNTARDMGRHRGRHPERLDGLVPKAATPASSRTDDLAMQAVSTQAALDLVVRTLTPAVAEMVVLRVMLGLDPAQVAKLVGRSPGAVRVAVHRGLRSLADAWATSMEGRGAAGASPVPVTVATFEAFTLQ
jgi:RNA polymerase sigma-70 factor (ECF subfamily)